MNRRRGVVLTAAIGLPLVLAGVAYAVHFQDRALPWTTVAGQSVVGQTREQVATSVKARAEAVTVTVTAGAASRTGTLTELGCPVDVDATVDAVFAANHSWTSFASALVSRHRVTAVVEPVGTTVGTVIDALVAGSGRAGSDATVGLAPDGASFTVTAPVPGQTVSPADYRTAVGGAAGDLASRDVTLTMVEAVPAVTTEQAQRVADAANAMVAPAVSVSDGTDLHAATAADKAAWVTVPMDDGTPGRPTLDTTKVGAWVDQVAAATNEAVTEGVRIVDAEGAVMSVVQRPADGRTASNVDAVVAELAAALSAGKDYAGTLTYDTVSATWTDQQVAAGDLVYAAADDEKWIDVNLAKHTMTAYQGGAVVRGPIAMVNGAKATPTIVGTFHIYSKVRTQTMRGDNADGTRYETPDVPWISYFYSGYALHGAPWRASFGYAGSHGCINLPVPVAQWIYTWAPVGTAVVTHR
ncbi:MAG: L,D-transpeptidase [Actinobacteria bacterium]|nr:L,D-transpeptidase [Actinomycetota bacterium]